MYFSMPTACNFSGQMQRHVWTLTEQQFWNSWRRMNPVLWRLLSQQSNRGRWALPVSAKLLTNQTQTQTPPLTLMPGQQLKWMWNISVFSYDARHLPDHFYAKLKRELNAALLLYLHYIEALLVTAHKDAGRGRERQRGWEGHGFLSQASRPGSAVGIARVFHLRHVVVIHFKNQLAVIVFGNHFKCI